MKAITFSQFGSPEVLQLTDVPEPHAGNGTIRVAVKAAGVNGIDWKIRNGWMQQVFPTRFPSIPGIEVAGIVDELGAGVTGVSVGDTILGWSEGGGYAEHAIARSFVTKPGNVSWEVAATLPVAGVTAWHVLNRLQMRNSETLLIHGAAGAVGSLAVQLAKARGVNVIGTGSAESANYIRSLGAIPVRYGDGLVSRVRAVAPAGVDAAFDTAGKNALEPSIELTGGTARVITIADPNAERHGVRFSAGSGDDFMRGLQEIVSLVASGALKVRIAKALPLASAGEAQQLSEAGHASGKIVLTVP